MGKLKDAIRFALNGDDDLRAAEAYVGDNELTPEEAAKRAEEIYAADGAALDKYLKDNGIVPEDVEDIDPPGYDKSLADTVGEDYLIDHMCDYYDSNGNGVLDGLEF